MESIGIRELRQHASRYVAMAKNGERVAVTERGRRVAYLVPAEESGGVLERLAEVGEYRPAVGALVDLLPVPEAPDGARPLSEIVEEMRSEERW